MPSMNKETASQGGLNEQRNNYDDEKNNTNTTTITLSVAWQ